MDKYENISNIIINMINDDKDAFNDIIELYYKKAIHIAYLISGRYADSEDIVQESFILCYINRKKIKEPQYFDKWLYKIVTRTAWKYCKKSNKEKPVEEVFDIIEKDLNNNISIIDNIVETQFNNDIFDIIIKLPIKQRTTIILYYYNEFSIKEIANIMGCFEGTVKSRLFTARRTIKRNILNNKYNYKKEVSFR